MNMVSANDPLLFKSASHQFLSFGANFPLTQQSILETPAVSPPKAAHWELQDSFLSDGLFQYLYFWFFYFD